MSWGKSFVVVTGASRGIGACICAKVAPLLGPGSVVVGVARTEEGLAATAALVKEANKDVEFVSLVMDLSKIDVEVVRARLTAVVAGLHPPGGGDPCQTSLMVHNAGSLGPLHYCRDQTNWRDITAYFDFNISSVVLFNAVFLQKARALQAVNAAMSIKVVNISSLAALQPFKSWSLYCTGKAARDMFFKALGEEEPDITVLNYSPGPIDTEMLVEARRDTVDQDLKKYIVTVKEEGKMLTPAQTVTKLLTVLQENKFSQGQHVDYYEDL